jgi:hypothetical protein
MWWVMAIMAVKTFLLPTELFVHEADEVPHVPSRLPDLRIQERMFDNGLR